jgi:hypothetical protein
MDDEQIRQELEAAVAARRELGPGHDEHLVEGFLDRIEQEIERRVDERVRRRSQRPIGPEHLGISIPIVVVAGIFGGVTGVVAALAALTVLFIIGSRR